jgi:oligopeptide transport system permease protein
LLQYALKRLLGAIPTLLLVIVLAFLMVHAAPGGPFDDERVLPPDTRAALEAAYNLDQPLHQQFIRYLGGVVTGDLGPSYYYRDYPVGELIGNAFPVSLQLGAMAMLLAVIVGVAAGTYAALHRNTLLDKT